MWQQQFWCQHGSLGIFHGWLLHGRHHILEHLQLQMPCGCPGCAAANLTLSPLQLPEDLLHLLVRPHWGQRLSMQHQFWFCHTRNAALPHICLSTLIPTWKLTAKLGPPHPERLKPRPCQSQTHELVWIQHCSICGALCACCWWRSANNLRHSSCSWRRHFELGQSDTLSVALSRPATTQPRPVCKSAWQSLQPHLSVTCGFWGQAKPGVSCGSMWWQSVMPPGWTDRGGIVLQQLIYIHRYAHMLESQKYIKHYYKSMWSKIIFSTSDSFQQSCDLISEPCNLFKKKTQGTGSCQSCEESPPAIIAPVQIRCLNVGRNQIQDEGSSQHPWDSHPLLIGVCHIVQGAQPWNKEFCEFKTFWVLKSYPPGCQSYMFHVSYSWTPSIPWLRNSLWF